MFGDWQIWRRTLTQSVIVLAFVFLISLAGREYAPAITRTLTRTPEPLLAACDSLGVEPARALVTGWAERGVGPDAVEGVLPGGVNGSASSPGTGTAAPSPSDPPLDAVLDVIAGRAMAILAGPDLPEAGPVLGEVTATDAVEYVLETSDCFYRTCARRLGAGAAGRIYLICSAEIKAPTALADRERRLAAALNSLGSTARRLEPVYTTVFAQLPGALDDVRCREAAARATARLHGRRVHEFDGNALYSLLSHSIMLGPTVEVAGRQVNLSVVLRPDTLSGSTWVVVGTPLCAGDY